MGPFRLASRQSTNEDADRVVPSNTAHADIREGVRALCAGFPASYFREIDRARGYPEAFVDAPGVTEVP
jgi:hypothetical protein